MSGYTSGNNAPTLMAQAPNRKGNVSKHVPGMAGPLGATAVVGGSGGTKYSSPNQGAPKTGGSATAGRGQKVMTSMHWDRIIRHKIQLQSLTLPNQRKIDVTNK